MQCEAPFVLATAHTVYLLHFEPGLSRASHYLGIARDDMLKRRWRDHVSGNGARIVRAAINAGSSVIVARTWPDATYSTERSLKLRGHFKAMCPLCNERLARSRAWSIIKLEIPLRGPTTWRDLTWSSACGPG